MCKVDVDPATLEAIRSGSDDAPSIWDFLPADMGYGGEDPNDNPDLDAMLEMLFPPRSYERPKGKSAYDSLPPDMGHGGEDPND